MQPSLAPRAAKALGWLLLGWLVVGTILGLVLGVLSAGSGLEIAGPAPKAMSGFTALPVHPDVPDGVRALRDLGLRLVTLTNGATAVGEQLLTRAGIRDAFELLLTVEDAGAWKPDPASYAYAARTCGVDASQMLLVAVHPWDIDGASRAGLSAAWVSRSGADYPGHFRSPTHTIRGLPELAALLSG